MICVSIRLFAICRMTCFVYDLFTIGSMTCFVYDHFSTGSMTCFVYDHFTTGSMTCFVYDHFTIGSMTCLLPEFLAFRRRLFDPLKTRRFYDTFLTVIRSLLSTRKHVFYLEDMFLYYTYSNTFDMLISSTNGVSPVFKGLIMFG